MLTFLIDLQVAFSTIQITFAALATMMWIHIGRFAETEAETVCGSENSTSGPVSDFLTNLSEKSETGTATTTTIKLNYSCSYCSFIVGSQ